MKASAGSLLPVSWPGVCPSLCLLSVDSCGSICVYLNVSFVSVDVFTCVCVSFYGHVTAHEYVCTLVLMDICISI